MPVREFAWVGVVSSVSNLAKSRKGKYEEAAIWLAVEIARARGGADVAPPEAAQRRPLVRAQAEVAEVDGREALEGVLVRVGEGEERAALAGRERGDVLEDELVQALHLGAHLAEGLPRAPPPQTTRAPPRWAAALRPSRQCRRSGWM